MESESHPGVAANGVMPPGIPHHRHRIGVVGGGFAGSSFCLQLYSKLISTHRHHAAATHGPQGPCGHAPVAAVEVFLFESGGEIGPGNAYAIDPAGDSFRLNRPKDSMDPFAGRVGQFSDWLAENGDDDAREQEFPKRSAYGKYLVHLMGELKRVTSAVDGSECPMRVHYLTRTSVDDITPTGGGDGKYVIHSSPSTGTPTGGVSPGNGNGGGGSGGGEWLVDEVVLCTGHFPVSTYKEFAAMSCYSSDHPGHKRLIRQVVDAAEDEAGGVVDVGIIGTSLTAIDIAVELQMAGHRGKIVMGSRNGMLTAVGEPISFKVFSAPPTGPENGANHPLSGGDLLPPYSIETSIGRSSEFQHYRGGINSVVDSEPINLLSGFLGSGMIDLNSQSGVKRLKNATSYATNKKLPGHSHSTTRQYASAPWPVVEEGSSQRILGPVHCDDLVNRFFADLNELTQLCGGEPVSYIEFRRQLAETTPLAYMSEQVASAESGSVKPWQLVLMAFAPMMMQFWERMEVEERVKFMREYNSTFMNYFGCAPAVNGAKLRDMLASGQLVVLKGVEIEAMEDGNEGGFVMKGLDTTSKRPDSYSVAVVFNASGYGSSPAEMPLFAKMLSRRHLVPHPFGGVQLELTTHQTYSGKISEGKKFVNEGMFAIGELTKGHYLLASSANRVAVQASKVVEVVVGKILATQ